MKNPYESKKRRYTIASLRADIETVNKKLKKSGSSYYYVLQTRNGYNAIDRRANDGYSQLLDCNEPPRVLNDKMQDDYEYYLGKTF